AFDGEAQLDTDSRMITIESDGLHGPGTAERRVQQFVVVVVDGLFDLFLQGCCHWNYLRKKRAGGLHRSKYLGITFPEWARIVHGIALLDAITGDGPGQ